MRFNKITSNVIDRNDDNETDDRDGHEQSDGKGGDTDPQESVHAGNSEEFSVGHVEDGCYEAV